MPIAYHVDRTKLLRSGQTISLLSPEGLNQSSQQHFVNNFFSDGLSLHGVKYLTDEVTFLVDGNIPDFSNVNRIISNKLLEFNIELLRKSNFPNIPSRYQSFFALPSIEELKKWPELNDDLYPIYEIEYEAGVVLDASHLRGGMVLTENVYGFSPTLNFDSIYNYLSGNQTSTPKLEILIPLPITIGKRINLK